MSLRIPYVGVGADGARRSAQIDRDEADTLAVDDPRHALLLESARRWDEQAKRLRPDSPTHFERVRDAGYEAGDPKGRSVP